MHVIKAGMVCSFTGKPSRRNRKLAGTQRGQSEHAALNRYEAFRLRAAKWSYSEIAAKLGVTVGTAFKYVESFWQEIKPITTERAELVRAMELQNLDELERVWMPVALRQECPPGGLKDKDGESQRPCDRTALAAVDRILKIKERRAKIAGTDLQPNLPESSAITGDLLTGFIRHQLGIESATERPILELKSGFEGIDESIPETNWASH